MAEFTARFYEVMKCGYYPYAADSEAELGGFEFLLKELEAWSSGKNLEDTRLPTSKNSFPTYLMSIGKRAGCWVIVLWNEVPSSEGTIASVVRTSKVGNPTIHENEIAENSIPGFPTYFLCMPDHDLVATLKYGDRVVGLGGFKSYISVFQEISTSIAVVDVDEDDPYQYNVDGYLDEAGDIHGLHAKFQLQLLRSGTQRAAILAQSARIRKIVKVKEMDPTVSTDRAWYQRGLAWLGMTAQVPVDAVKFRQEIEVSPSREDVAAIIDSVIDDVEAKTNDVGFYMRGEGSPMWLSGSIPGHVLEIDVQQENGAFNAAAVANAVSRRKQAILASAG